MSLDVPDGCNRAIKTDTVHFCLNKMNRNSSYNIYFGLLKVKRLL